jgi:uncharacterized protein (TIGR03437 family)
MMQWRRVVSARANSRIRSAFFLAGWLLLGSFSFAQDSVTVVNGASFRTDQPVTAGSWVSGFGVFANVGEVFNTDLPLPKTLGGVTITVNGVQAPINYVSGLQVNFVVPYETAPGLHQVVVNGPAGAVNGTVRVINAAPGLFVIDPPPRGAILNQDNSLNEETRPAIRGQVIQIFATGHSTLSQAIEDGAPGPIPAIETEVDPQVFIGGVECTVEFSGLAPNFAALWQINARIPELSFLSGELPLQVFMNGVDSNEVTLHVAP